MENALRQDLTHGRPLYDSEIEYLETDGSAYIDLGVPPAPDGSFTLKTSYDMSKSYIALFGTAYYGGWNVSYNDQDFAYSMYVGQGGYAGLHKPNLTDETVVLEFKNKDGIYVNANKVVVWNSIMSNVSLDDTCCLFYQKPHAGKTARPCQAGVKIYSASVQSTSNLDLIPVRVGSEAMMYDRIYKKLYPNAGKGAFISDSSSN